MIPELPGHAATRVDVATSTVPAALSEGTGGQDGRAPRLVRERGGNRYAHILSHSQAIRLKQPKFDHDAQVEEPIQ